LEIRFYACRSLPTVFPCKFSTLTGFLPTGAAVTAITAAFPSHTQQDQLVDTPNTVN